MLTKAVMTMRWLLCGLSCLALNLAAADEYRDRIQPYMQKYCQDCHAGEKAKGELDLAKVTGASDVVSNFRRWKHVIEFIKAGEMPPEASLQPSITESQQVITAIEGLLITAARKHAGDPGVILPRRLSNTEYDRAIRDLTGIDIRPTRDFPVDPAGGEGFDNTGEALRMSPNLLKKSLGAAQSVSEHLVLTPTGIIFAPFPVTSYNERKKLTEQAVIDFYEAHAVDRLGYLEAAWRYQHRPSTQAAVSIEDWAAQRQLSAKYLSIVWNVLHGLQPEAGLNAELQTLWQAIPAPTGATGRPQELLTFHDTLLAIRKLLTPPTAPLIQSNAGNWPIYHLDFRTKVARRRDRFEPAAFQSTAMVRTNRVPNPDPNAARPRSLFLRFDQGFSTGEARVIVQQPLFSQADQPPRNDEERRNHKVDSLRSILERHAPELLEALQFGKDTKGNAIDAESFVIKVPTTIKIPLTVELQGELKGRQLLLPCTLDRASSPNGSVLIQTSWETPPTRRWTAASQLLMTADSPAAQALTPAAEAFCLAFPDEFAHVDDSRGLAAGFHLVEGFFRDDRPLVEKVLDDRQNAQLNKLWEELDFVTESAETLLRGFVWFERSERAILQDPRFDFLRADDPLLVEESLLGQFERHYLDKVGIKRVGDTLQAETPDEKFAMVHGFFESVRQGLARQRQLLVTAEGHGLADLERLAGRAYRRPLSIEERDSLRALYRTLRKEGQTVEGGLRGVLTAILMSPHFSYYIPTVAEGSGVAPLRDLDLATRLSLFLWSSLPDDELLAVAAGPGLQDEARLLEQARRMLKDPRVDGFAREFFGQWLRYRDYLDKDPINAEAFPGYSEELRAAIFEEPVRLATHLIQSDRPITELLTSDVTFVNRVLAAHYGGELQRQYQTQRAGNSPQTQEDWQRVTGLQAQGRGGLIGMAVILTKTSAGERPSPVKRGFWTVHHLLGQHFPPPPADVPELPKSEKEATKTIRVLLADHVANAQCAMCHKHFDSLGLAMEGFDAIGHARTADTAGRPIDNRAELPNGSSARGIPELIRYLEQHRKQEFVRTLCRKLLGYALGRSVKLSDEPLLTEMEAALQTRDDRFSALFEVIIRSPQFRQQRARDFVADGQQ